MKYAACLLVAFASSGAFASEVGQPLDCSDWTILVPGITCSASTPLGLLNAACSLWVSSGGNLAIDNEGYRYALRTIRVPLTGCDVCDPATIEVVRFRGSTEQVVASVSSREAPDFRDNLRTVDAMSGCCSGGCGSSSGPNLTVGDHILFDPIAGRLLVTVKSFSNPNGGGWWIMALDGFASLFDVLQSYTPQPAALGFRVPAHPEGMRAADHFDTYWGHLSTVGDWSQAHPLQCNYPAAAPNVGDYLTVADTVPTPVPGRGIYYVTAATYQGATRYGRKTTAGHLTGRDPALLPACTP